MTALRSERLADLVLDYSIEIQKSDRLLLQFDPVYWDYAKTVGNAAALRGAEVRYDSRSHDPKTRRALIEKSDPKEWQEELQRRKDLSSWCNTRIYIYCESNPNYGEGIENFEEKVARFEDQVIRPHREVLYRPGPHQGYEVRWNIVGFPSLEGAERAGMDSGDFYNFVYSATLGNDWKKMGEGMRTAKRFFDGAKDVHILVPGLTDLHLSLEGRGGEICDGKFNMPDGEFCYGPVENSARGYITFQVPTRREGLGVLERIRLEFKDGLVSKFSARKNQKALAEALKLDGARRIGELGIGCNYGIKRAILDTLFDEKVGGTIHLALGDSLSQNLDNGGGLNKSSIHWDLVCDLRKNEANLAEFPGGQIRVDGELVQTNGTWLL